MSLGTVRVGEALYPVTQIHLEGGGFCVHFITHGPGEHDIWILYGPDGDFVFRTTEPRAMLNDPTILPGDHVDIAWHLEIDDKLVRQGRPDTLVTHE